MVSLTAKARLPCLHAMGWYINRQLQVQIPTHLGEIRKDTIRTPSPEPLDVLLDVVESVLSLIMPRHAQTVSPFSTCLTSSQGGSLL